MHDDEAGGEQDDADGDVLHVDQLISFARQTVKNIRKSKIYHRWTCKEHNRSVPLFNVNQLIHVRGSWQVVKVSGL